MSTISEILKKKFTEILESESEKKELTEEEAETVQTSIFNNTGMYLAFSDVKKLFKTFRLEPDKKQACAAGERTQTSHA